ncbi:hypothetical protein [Sphingomonas sp.]|jgi:hypothetical protein|uniref:hypothetical protein n=1 Tax=Sphingomonas sp. TaxID=28214 RepID=UPI002EDBAA43
MPLDGNFSLFPTYNAANIRDFGGGNAGETLISTAGADAFLFRSSASGRNDAIVGFEANDSLIADQDIFDGNGDGYIDFGGNNVLDVERTGAGNSKRGDYSVSVAGQGGDSIQTIRYLGSKDGSFVYASADTRDQLLGHFKKGFDSTQGFTGGDSSLTGFATRYDSSVATETFNVGNTSAAILFDNQLGLNLGGDTVNGFGTDDLLIFTSALYDGDRDGFIRFDKNRVLDVSAQDPDARDPVTVANGDSTGAPGGQVDVNGATDVLKIEFLGSKTIGTGLEAVTYYYYGHIDGNYALDGVGGV